jgi:hypothetical protein
MLPCALVSHGGSGRAVEQHLYHFLLEFLRVNAPLGPVLLVDLPGTPLGCWIRKKIGKFLSEVPTSNA